MLLQLLLWPVSVRFSVILLNSLPDIVYYSPPPSLSRAIPCAHLSIYLYSLPLLIIAFFILLKRFVTDFLSK